MSQTSVLDRMTIAVAGMLADDTLQKDVLSKFNGEASAEIPFGVFVGLGTADDEVIRLAANTDKLAGVTVFGHAYAQSVELGDTGMKPGVMMDVLQQGRIYVFPEDAVTPASGVHVRAVAAGAEVKGALRGTADGTDTIDISSFARWRTTGSSTVPAVLEIDMTNRALQAADS